MNLFEKQHIFSEFVEFDTTNLSALNLHTFFLLYTPPRIYSDI